MREYPGWLCACTFVLVGTLLFRQDWLVDVVTLQLKLLCMCCGLSEVSVKCVKNKDSKLAVKEDDGFIEFKNFKKSNSFSKHHFKMS
jgi:hypothetical protein